MGDAKRRAIEIADLKANSPSIEEQIKSVLLTPMTVDEIFDPLNALKHAALKGAPNWVALKEKGTRLGDRKHAAGHGEEYRDAVIDNQRFDVSAAVTKRLAEKAKAEAVSADVSRIATGLSDSQQEVVSESTSEGPSDLLREDGPNVGTYGDQQADVPSAVDINQQA